jgi:threonine synthase
MAYFSQLVCRECGHGIDIAPESVCEECFGPVEADYDYERISNDLQKSELSLRPFTMWRYKEFMPVQGEPIVGLETGGTPLLRAEKLGQHWGLQNLYIKNDAVNFPTLSFKDRVVSVAISCAKEFGFNTVACASTGNLANSVAAQAAAVGLPSFIFIPHDLEESKITATQCYGPNLVRLRGSYDDVNRLCSEIVYEHSWGFVNINLRPFYAEGSKTMGFEIVEQLDWRIPDAVVVPMAGGALINKIQKAFNEFERVGYCESHACKIFGAQASGCNPITHAVKKGSSDVLPQRPNTIAKSLAIGSPADGHYAVKTILESGGWGEDATDEEILAGIALLAETEGVFTETAGGVTVAVAEKLIAQGRIRSDDVTVLCITGNGLKTQEVLKNTETLLPVIEPKLDDFHSLVEKENLLQIDAQVN